MDEKSRKYQRKLIKNRPRGRGDAKIGSPLAAACDEFRLIGLLHSNSTDGSIINFAFGDGRDRPGAAGVRQAVSDLPEPKVSTAGAREGDKIDPEPSSELPECPHADIVESSDGVTVCLDCGEVSGERTELRKKIHDQVTIRSPLFADVAETEMTQRGETLVRKPDTDEEEILI